MKIKAVKQHDERDCGAACLSMIASYYGLQYPLEKFRDLTKTDRNGANLYGMVDAAKQIGLESDALQGDINELTDGINSNEIKFPFVAHTITQDGFLHYVVISSIKNNIVTVYDPAKGKRKISLEEFSHLWTGYIVTFEKTDKFKEGNYTKGTLFKFFGLLKGQKRFLVSVLIMSIFISLVGIMGTFIFQTVIDDFSYSQEEVNCYDEDCSDEDHIHEDDVQEIASENSNILETCMNVINDNAHDFSLFFKLLIGLYILQALIQFIRGYMLAIISKKIDISLMLSYYKHVIDLPVSKMNTRLTGEYISRFSDASTIRNAVSGATITLLLDTMMVILGGILLCDISVKMFLISLSMVIIYLIVVLCYKKPIKDINYEVMENNARVQSYLKESIDGSETIKANTSEVLVKEKTESKFNVLINKVLKASIIENSQDSLLDLVESVGTILILWVGFSLVKDNMLQIGALITFYALLSYFTSPIKNLIELQPMMQKALVAAERLNDILDSKKEELEYKDIKESINNIEFKNVDFRYGNRELTLKDISLSINKGEKVAIVGESGSGKTSLAKLLLRFYEHEKGSIKINNKDIKDFELGGLRKKIAYIDQNTFLFSDTIVNNIKLGNPDATLDEIKEVCKLSRADEFIEKLPQKYEEYLDENGHNLSGGQRQRLAIARALLKKPDLLILDEATSNLDTITEESIKNTIFNIDKELTCIIIAHRLSTIKNCDKILVMKDGCIVEVGNHNELINKKGLYYELCERQ